MVFIIPSKIFAIVNSDGSWLRDVSRFSSPAYDYSAGGFSAIDSSGYYIGGRRYTAVSGAGGYWGNFWKFEKRNKDDGTPMWTRDDRVDNPSYYNQLWTNIYEPTNLADIKIDSTGMYVFGSQSRSNSPSCTKRI